MDLAMWFLVIGLGNPGKDYSATRHNVGFRVVDCLAERHGVAYNKKQFFSQTGQGRIAQQKVLLLKPMTYMNQSGKAVQAAIAYLKVPAERVLVVHDDMDLSLGRIQVKQGGGHGGHRGLQSVIETLSNSEFTRIRIGIGKPTTGQDGADYVLEPFDSTERKVVDDVVERATEAIVVWLENGIVTAMNRYNTWPNSTSEV